MTKQQHVPSKFEEFIAVFGAAIGLSVLFMFALSSFVNMLYQRDGDHSAHSRKLANSNDKQYDQICRAGQKPICWRHKWVIAKPKDHKPVKTKASANYTVPWQAPREGQHKKGCQSRQKMYGLS